MIQESTTNNQIELSDKETTGCSSKFILASSLESIDSTVGLFMIAASFCDAMQLGLWSMVIPGIVAILFGTAIFYYTLKLLKQKNLEEEKKKKDKITKPTIYGGTKIFLIFTTIGSGLDGAAPLLQESIGYLSTSKAIVIGIVIVAFLVFLCNGLKYYCADLATQFQNPGVLPGMNTLKKKNSKWGCFWRYLIFQIFPIYESIAHLLAMYIVYSNFAQPYLMSGQSIDDLFHHITIGYSITTVILLLLGAFISSVGCAAEYVIIKGAGLDWADETLEGDNKNVLASLQINNNFGGFGRLMLFILSLGCGDTSARVIQKNMCKRIKSFKILIQSVFVGAAFLLIASLIATGFRTTKIAGSLNNLKISHVKVVIIVSVIFFVGCFLGAILGYRQWKLKNANHEIDLFCAAYVIANYLNANVAELNQKKEEWIQLRVDENKKDKYIWAEKSHPTDQKYDGPKSKPNKFRDRGIPIILSMLATIGGVIYARYTKSSIFTTVEFGIAGILIGILVFCLIAKPKRLLEKKNDVEKLELVN